MSRLGIYASQISGHLTAPSDYESIETVTVGSGGQSSITFSSIPSTYKNLQIRLVARTNRASTGDWGVLRFNSDSGSNYSYHDMYGEGSGTGATYYGANQTYIELASFTAASSTASVFAPYVIDILDYQNTSKYKTTRQLGGNDSSSSGVINFGSGNWRSSSAITSITLTPGAGSNFAEFSSFALYGIKG